MPQYVLLNYLPAGYKPTPDEIREEQPKWAQFAKDLAEAGALQGNQGLAGAEAATTVRVREGETQITDGPFAETKEVLAGVFQIEVADLDEALKWAARMPSSAFGAVEVRPLWG